MSLHRSHVNVQGVEISGARAIFDVHNARNIELSEFPSSNNFSPSSSAEKATNTKKSTSKKKFYVKLWARVTKSFVDWWARITEIFVGWWTRIMKSFVDGWIGELLAILLSISAFFAVIVILLKYDGHPLPRLLHNVPLNFVVSTLATISKSSLLLAVTSAFGQFKWLWMFSKQRRLQDLQIFDEASRGPLGAFKLLASKKSLKSWASIGAFVTIFCLVFDPFVQGLISVSEREVYKNNTASLVNRIEDYPDMQVDTNYPLINTINNAAFNPNLLSEIPPRCPTGNCTWPLFTSLGFCSKCQDVSQLVRNSSSYVDKIMTPENSGCHRPPIGQIQRVSSSTPECKPATRDYTYKFPELNGQVLMADSYGWLPSNSRSFSNSIDISLPGSGINSPAFFVVPLTWNYTAAYNTTTFNFTDGTSIPVEALIVFIRTSTNDSELGNVSTADLCALSFCAQKRNVSVTLNQPSSTILQNVYATRHLRKFSDDNPVGEGNMWLSFTGDNFTMTFPPTKVTGSDYYNTMVNNWAYNLKSLMRSFQGNMTGNVGFRSSPEAPPNVIGAFRASSNLSLTMNNIAIELTNYLRNSSNITIAGQAGQAELYVHVTWPWITLPASLVIAGTIFLMFAIFETKKLGARIWKTSELALLFHGLEKSNQELGTLLKSSEMEDMASKTRVKVVKTSGGRWILR